MSQLHFDHPVLQYFQALSQVPRGSGNERGVSDWLMEFAAAHGLAAAALRLLAARASRAKRYCAA